MIDINQVQLRDTVIFLAVVSTLTPMFFAALIWVINRYLKRGDVRDEKVDDFISITTNTLSELKTITAVHEAQIEQHSAEIGQLKEDVRGTFMIKYNKGK